MASKIFKFGTPEKVILCDFSGQYLGINQVDPKQEITKVVCRAANLMPGSAMFFFNSNEFLQYYVWYNKEDANKDPKPGGKTGIEIKINNDDTAIEIAEKTALKISEVEGFTSTSSNNVITITSDEFGDIYPPADFNTGFDIVVEQKGQYTASLFAGKLWSDCREIKDVNLFEDGSAEVFFTLAKQYVNRMNLNKRFDISKEFFMDNYRVIPAGWLNYI